MRSPVIFKEWPLYLFFSGRCNLRFTSQLSAEWQTRRREQSSAEKTQSRVFVCVPVNRDMPCFLTHAATGLTVSLPLPAAFTTLPGGKRSGCSPWFECTRGRLLQTQQATGCWIGGNQAPGCQTQWVKMFLAWLNFRVGGGRLEVVSMTA